MISLKHLNILICFCIIYISRIEGVGNSISKNILTTFDLEYTAETIAWHPFDSQLAATQGDGKITVFNTENGEKNFDILLNHLFPRFIAWSPNGKYLLCLNDDEGSLRYFTIIDMDNHEIIMEIEAEDYDGFLSASWGPNSKQIALVQGLYETNRINIIAPSTGETRLSYQITDNQLSDEPLSVLDALWISDTELIAVVQVPTEGGTIANSITIVDLVTKSNSPVIQNLAPNSGSASLSYKRIDISQKLNLFAVIGNADYLRLGHVWIWDVKNLDVVGVLESQQGLVKALAWNPLNNLIGTTDENGNIFIWDAITYEIVDSKNISPAIGISIDWNPNGDTLAVSDNRGVIHLLKILN